MDFMEGKGDSWKLDLDPLLNPRSIAVVGISGGQKVGMGNSAVKNLQRFGYRGLIFPVNPKYNEIQGLKCYKSLLDIPEDVDLVVVVVPADTVLQVMREASEKKVKAATTFSGGFAEAGEKGRQLQAELVKICEENKIRLCGPNNMGAISFREHVMMYTAHIPEDARTGGLAIIGQSGSIAMCIFAAAYARGIGCSYLVTSGNEAVIEASDYIRFMLNDDNTKVIGCYIEGFKNPHRFKEVAALALEKGKPIVIYKVGHSPKGKEAAFSHTGSIAGSDEVQEAFFRQKGVIRVDEVEELVETSELFIKSKLPKRNRIAFPMISGGGCGIVSDLSYKYGLELPELSRTVREALTPLIPSFGRIANPLDLTGTAYRNPDMYYKCLEILLKEDVDILCIDPDNPWIEPLIPKVQELATKTDKLLTILCLAAENMDEAKRKIWQDSTIPIFQSPNRGLKAIKSLIDYSRFVEKRRSEAPAVIAGNGDFSKVKAILGRTGKVLTEYQSKQLLHAYGIPITREELAHSPEEALEIARRIGYPVALKVQSEKIAHKTEAKAIRLNIKQDREVLPAYEEVLSSAKRHAPEATVEGVLVQEMVPEGTETMVGMVVDEQFGPCLVFGLGGIFVEVLKDISMRVAPLSKTDATEMIGEIRGFQILKGFRGMPPADIEAIANVLTSLSRLSLDLKEYISDIDINPLILDPKGKGVKVVDALIALR
jgi:acyl-CoA synthetase (NDP forming)